MVLGVDVVIDEKGGADYGGSDDEEADEEGEAVEEDVDGEEAAVEEEDGRFGEGGH